MNFEKSTVFSVSDFNNEGFYYLDAIIKNLSEDPNYHPYEVVIYESATLNRKVSICIEYVSEISNNNYYYTLSSTAENRNDYFKITNIATELFKLYGFIKVNQDSSCSRLLNFNTLFSPLFKDVKINLYIIPNFDLLDNLGLNNNIPDVNFVFSTAEQIRFNLITNINLYCLKKEENNIPDVLWETVAAFIKSICNGTYQTPHESELIKYIKHLRTMLKKVNAYLSSTDILLLEALSGC